MGQNKDTSFFDFSILEPKIIIITETFTMPSQMLELEVFPFEKNENLCQCVTQYYYA